MYSTRRAPRSLSLPTDKGSSHGFEVIKYLPRLPAYFSRACAASLCPAAGPPRVSRREKSTHAIAISQCHSTTQAFLCKVCGWKISYVRWESLRKLGLEERGNKAWRSPRRCPWGALYKSCTFRDTALAETCTFRDTHPHRASQRPRVSRVVLFF